jgi:hypothetical protein
MSKIKNFKEFCLNENQDDIFFRRHLGDNSSSYTDRAKNYYDLGNDPSALTKTESFFQRMEDRFNRASSMMQAKVQQNRATRSYGGPDTGVELLFGAASVVPSILKRVFGPTKFDFKKSEKEEVPVELMRHTNEDFIRNELPSIHSEEDLAKHIEGLYGNGQVTVGKEPVLDDLAKNRANIYYQRQANPNSPVLKVPAANQPAYNQQQPALQPNN